jgi:hypothetical protein
VLLVREMKIRDAWRHPASDEERRRRWRHLESLFALCAVCSSCRSTPRDEGIRIGDKTLEQFQPNQTSEHGLVSIIGQPTSRTEVAGLDEPVSILGYSTIERGPAGLFLLFTGSTPPRRRRPSTSSCAAAP